MSDDPEESIRRAVERSNPRRSGESARDWSARLSGILSRAVKRYWNDVREIMDEAAVDTDEARRLYRDALETLDADRSETTRDKIIEIVSEFLKEEEVPTEPTGEAVIWQGDEFVFSLMENQASTINAKLPGGLHTYAANVWIYKGGTLIGDEEIVFEATPSEWWQSFHDEAREYFMSTVYPRPRGSTATIVYQVSEIRVVQ